jgi:hypothetical protein
MRQTREDVAQNLAERLCWQVARRDDSRVARRLYRGWKLIVLIDARTKLPVAAKVVPIHVHETLLLRALVVQAQTNLAGHARLHKVVFDKSVFENSL